MLLLFITAIDFGERWNKLIEQFQAEYLQKYFYFLEPCYNYVFQVSILPIYTKKGKDECYNDFFTFTDSVWALLLERSYFIVENQSACCYSQFQKIHPLWRAGRPAFRTQSDFYDGAFFVEIVNGLRPLTITQKIAIVYIGLSSKCASGRRWQEKRIKLT